MIRFGLSFFATACILSDVVLSAEHPCAQGKLIAGKLDPSPQAIAGDFKLVGSDVLYTLAGLAHVRDPFDGVRLDAFLSLYAGDGRPDRYGRMAVQAYENGHWLQGKLLQRGRALRSGVDSSGHCLQALIDAERQGETTKSGIWRTETGQTYSATNLEKLSAKFGHFVLVKGNVVSVGDRTRRLYLNFGQKWSQDFTVSVVKKGSGAFKGNMAHLAGLKNKTVRVRGILEERQGPLIRLIHEAQIEIIE